LQRNKHDQRHKPITILISIPKGLIQKFERPRRMQLRQAKKSYISNPSPRRSDVKWNQIKDYSDAKKQRVKKENSGWQRSNSRRHKSLKPWLKRAQKAMGIIET
jgi:hypothetical protein